MSIPPLTIGALAVADLNASLHTIESIKLADWAGNLDDSRITFAKRAANLVLASPATATGTPDFRALVAADIPNLNASKITTGTLALARGGTGADLSGTGGANQVVKQTSAGGALSVGALVAADIPNLDATKITSGTLADARLSSSVVIKNAQSQITNSAQMHASVAASGTSLTDSVATTIAFDSEFYDVGTLHDNVTNNSRITIPTGGDGMWLFIADVTIPAAAGGTQRQALIVQNGGTVLCQTMAPFAAGLTTHLQATALASASATDYFEVSAYQDSGGALTTGSPTSFTAMRLF